LVAEGVEVSPTHAVVTGGASGIGLAVVTAFLDRGLDVTVLDLTVPDEQLEGVRYYPVDVTDAAAVTGVMDAAAETGTVPDVLVTCHGIRGAFVPALELEPDAVRRVFDVHVMGTFLVATAFARWWLRNRRDQSSPSPRLRRSAAGRSRPITGRRRRQSDSSRRTWRWSGHHISG
jgi:NAD(P)-dependent dehydrogenase (short-subunit alcohol dehydrogenase family)